MVLRWSAREAGIDDLEGFFEYAGYKARDMREPLNWTADLITAIVIEAFDTEGAASGNPWIPLTDDYAKWKDRHAPGRLILELTGEMRAWVADRGQWKITMTNAVYEPPGPLGELAGWHQEGVPDRHSGGFHNNKPNPLPARPILELRESDYQEIEDLFIAWLDELRSASPARGGPAAPPSIFG